MTTNLRTAYFVLCVLGLVLPYSQFVPWVMVHGLDVSLFLSELFANRIGGFFGMDVLVSACVLKLFIFVEGRRLGMQNLWLPVIGTFLACFFRAPALPVFAASLYPEVLNVSLLA